MKFPNGSIVFRNAATRKFFANSWYYEPAKWLSIRAHVKILYLRMQQGNLTWSRAIHECKSYQYDNDRLSER